MNTLETPDGMTVRQLKNWISQLPDKDENGYDRQVWVETGRYLSSPVRVAWTMNMDASSCDILLASDKFDSENADVMARGESVTPTNPKPQ